MNKIDLQDVTFNIPIKIDSEDRIKNLQNCIKWIRQNFNTNIILYEGDITQKIKYEINDNDIKYYYHYSKLFHRTRYLNEMAKISQTPIIINHDIDVVFPVNQILESIEKIRSNELDGVFPYDKHFIDMKPETTNILSNDFNFNKINPQNENIIGYDVNIAKKMKGVASVASVGGCIIWNKKKFIEGGMENEKFISYGYEDNERVYRFETLGYNIGRVKGNLYHMHHSRGKDSSVNHGLYMNNRLNYNKISQMNESELKQEIELWEWTK